MRADLYEVAARFALRIKESTHSKVDDRKYSHLVSTLITSIWPCHERDRVVLPPARPEPSKITSLPMSKRIRMPNPAALSFQRFALTIRRQHVRSARHCRQMPYLSANVGTMAQCGLVLAAIPVSPGQRVSSFGLDSQMPGKYRS